MGTFLPSVKMEYVLSGKWKETKYGLQYEVQSISEDVKPDKPGIIKFLASGLIPGIGTTTAETIYNTFGNDTLNIIKKEPDKLLSIKGISKKRLKKIHAACCEYYAQAESLGMLVSFGITSSKAVAICRELKSDTLDVIKNHPYRLSDIKGIGFETANKIAIAQKIPSENQERCLAIMKQVLKINEYSGHLYMSPIQWQEESYKLIASSKVTPSMVHQYGQQLIKEGQVKYVTVPEYNGGPMIRAVYRKEAAEAETKTAIALKGIIKNPLTLNFDAMEEIEKFESRMGFQLGIEQKLAVDKSLKNSLSIITGGPGSGKTTIIRAIYEIYKTIHPSSNVLLCAPTGRAAKRMTESVGVEAHTIHSVLQIYDAFEDSMDDEVEKTTIPKIKAALVIVDECSMLDMYLSSIFFQAIDEKTQVILLGDVDQLPSVGPGAVFDELIKSEVVPLSRLRKVYRQKNGSMVVKNALKIRDGLTDIEFDNDSFVFIEANSFAEAATKMKEAYIDEIAINGLDSVAMLSPYRKSTESGSNAINACIQDIVNPPQPTKPEITLSGGRKFRLGDRIIQTQNTHDASNGDVGYITSINTELGTITVNFDGTTNVVYKINSPEIEIIELAYATTVHKSQGSEYDIVIFNLLDQHKNMLFRNLLYTAVTRAKEKVIIVGQKSAINTAIHTDLKNVYKRNTLLSLKLKLI